MILASGAGGAAGPLGLLVVLLIAAATVFLIRNMNARLRRLPKEFDSSEDVPSDEDPDPLAG